VQVNDDKPESRGAPAPWKPTSITQRCREGASTPAAAPRPAATTCSKPRCISTWRAPGGSQPCRPGSAEPLAARWPSKPAPAAALHPNTRRCSRAMNDDKPEPGDQHPSAVEGPRPPLSAAAEKSTKPKCPQTLLPARGARSPPSARPRMPTKPRKPASSSCSSPLAQAHPAASCIGARRQLSTPSLRAPGGPQAGTKGRRSAISTQIR